MALRVLGLGPAQLWSVEHLYAKLGQAVVLCDCLRSQWTEQVLLKAWAHQQVWLPLAPDTTSFLAEPGTIDHSQLTAHIRRANAVLHRALEHAHSQADGWGASDQVCPQLGPIRGRTSSPHSASKLQGGEPESPPRGPHQEPYPRLPPERRGLARAHPPGPQLGGARAPPNERHPVQVGGSAPPVGQVVARGATAQAEVGARRQSQVPLFERPCEKPEDTQDEQRVEIESHMLELTPYQREMLKPLEARMVEARYTASTRARVAPSTTSLRRRNRWALWQGLRQVDECRQGFKQGGCGRGSRHRGHCQGPPCPRTYPRSLAPS